MQHLGAVIENSFDKEKYVSELITYLNNQLQLLSKMEETEPQSAYAAFVSSFKRKTTYFIHIISDIGELLLPLEHTIRQNSFQLSQVVKFVLTMKEYCYHYQHGTEN